jgi:hypothetical protein
MVLLPGGEECSVVWQILALDYLKADVPRPPERFLSFADFVEVRTYLKVFEGRVTGRLARGVARDAQEFAQAAERCGGVKGGSPPAYLFRFLPRLELQVTRYEGEEDLPPACNVLFPDNAMQVLSPECVIAAAELLVSALKGKRPCD